MLLYTFGFLVFALDRPASAQGQATSLTWLHLTTADSELQRPTDSTQQTAALILDIDRDGRNDFVIGSRLEPGPALVWFRRTATGWERYLIEASPMPIEAGGAYHDIDRDGDLDLVMGGDAQSKEIWWWENPAPNFTPTQGWRRYVIKNSGATKHHDQLFGDFDGDGQAELVFWNQRATTLFLAEVPANPRSTTPWPLTAIYQWNGGLEHEGLAAADIDGDGITDIIGGGRWFKFAGAGRYTASVIDDQQRFSRAAAGQLIPGGAPEVVFGCGDCTGPLQWYEKQGDRWLRHDLLPAHVEKGHSLALADFNGDGALDIFTAEMRLNSSNSKAQTLVLLGDNQGRFTTTVVATGYGNHESKVGDLDGDGTPDILGKPYNWQTPRLDIWLNQRSCTAQLGQWQRHVVDANRPWRSLFILAGDVNGDQLPDITTGGWWYRNPGTPSGAWSRQTIGGELKNVAAIADFDSDGDLDLLGGQGEGNANDARLAWARNAGNGNFTVLTNLAAGQGDFLQGVAVGRWQGNSLGVALSWHRDQIGVQALQVPANPSTQPWSWQRLSAVSQHEALSGGDIDRDGDLDLLLGTIWLRNDGAGRWQPLEFHSTTANPDRNRLADINGDGRLDAVVGYEAVSKAGLVAWYAQGADPAAPWPQTAIATVTGPMSLDVADLDNDGDLDVVVGEHNLAKPANAALFVFENRDGRGGAWQQHLVYRGDEHHDGAQLVDIDRDGDLDIISIGWGHDAVVLYENRGTTCAPAPSATPTPLTPPAATPTPTPTLIMTAPPTVTPTATPLAACSVSHSLITNPGFEQMTADWTLQKNKQATLTLADGQQGCGNAALITLAKPQQAQLFQSNIPLEPNTRYRLSFAAFATNGNDLTVQLHKHKAPYTNYGLKVKTVDLGTAWQTFTYEFVTKGFKGNTTDGRLRFWFNGKEKEVGFFLDNVVLEKMPVERSEPSASDPSADIAESVIDPLYAQAPLVELYQQDGELVAGVFLTTTVSPQLVVGALDQAVPSASEVAQALQLLNQESEQESDAPLIPFLVAPGLAEPTNALFLPFVFGN